LLLKAVPFAEACSSAGGIRSTGQVGKGTCEGVVTKQLPTTCRTSLFSGLGEVRANDVVNVACDALVAGLDSPALRILGACAPAEAEYDVPDLLPTSLDELHLVSCPFGSEAGKEACVRALARQLLAGKLTPRELVSRVHQRLGRELPMAERLAELDDEYDVLGYGDRTLVQVDAEVTDEARRLAAMPAPRSAGGPP
jgi:hypothetical protein